MKKRFLLVLAIFVSLTSLYAVLAQEEVTKGKILGIDLFIILPIILVLISLIFFFGLYFKDHYKNIVYNFKTGFRKKNLKEARIGTVDYLKEVQALQKQLRVLESEEAITCLSNLAKRFFAEKFNVNYEFAHEELEKKLEKEKAAWALFPKKLLRLNYSGEPLSKKEVEGLVKEFWNIVNYEKRKELGMTMIDKPKKRSLNFEIGIFKNLRSYLEKIKPKEKEKIASKDVIKHPIKSQNQRPNILIHVLKKVKTDAVNELKMQLGAINRTIALLSSKLTRRITPIQPAEKIKKEEKKLVYKGETSLTRLKEFGKFFTKKEEAIEKAFKQTQKQVSNQIHNITKPAKTKPSEPIKKEPEQAKELVKIKHELIPHKPLALPPIHAEKKEIKELTNVNTSIEKEQKLQKEKERLFKLPIKTPKIKMNIEHLKKLQEEKKERLSKPLTETPKVRIGTEHLKELQVKEKEVIKKVQKPSRIPLKPAQTIREKQPLKYKWEITAEDIKKKKTRRMTDLLKEEQDIQSKLKELE